MQIPPAQAPGGVRLWSLAEDSLLEVGPDDDDLVVLTRWGEIRIADTDPAVRESLERLSLGPVSVRNLPILRPAGAARAGAASASWRRFRELLEQLGSCVVQSLGLGDGTGPVLSVTPVSPRARFWTPVDVPADRPIRLSRFAVSRAAGGGDLLLESPLTRHRAVLHRPVAAWVVGSLARPTTLGELAGQLSVPAPLLADLVAYLVGSGFVLVGEGDGVPRFAEDTDPGLAGWSPQDLLFHVRTRGDPAGPPVPRAGGGLIPLDRPDLARLVDRDPPLAAVVEASRTEPPDVPLTTDRLSELLHRIGRLHWAPGPVRTEPADPALPDDEDGLAGFPGLALYVSVERCAGLPRGTYRYDLRRHGLVPVGGPDPALAELVEHARVGAGSTRRPDVVLTMTVRMARIAPVRAGAAYSLALTHVGALQQALLLAAAAMGLRCRTVAVGDGAPADEALRLEWPKEVSVSHFLVGIRRYGSDERAEPSRVWPK